MAKMYGGGLGGSAPGAKVSVDALDTTSGFLAAKIAAGAGIALSILNPGGAEQLQIRSTIVGGVSSVFGRAGAVVAALNDYAASLIQNDSGVAGATVKAALDALNARVTGVSSVFGRAGAVVAALNDYAASLIQNDSGVTGATVKAALDALNAGKLTSFDGRTIVAATDTVADLTALAALANSVNGSRIFVISEGETYTLDTANAFVVSSPLIIAASGGGRWFRRSKAYVVGNFTLWVAPFGGPTGGDGPNVIDGYTPGQQITNSGNGDIVLDLSATFTNDQTLFDVVVDNLGNIWCTSYATAHNAATGRTAKFLLRDIQASGSPTPSVTITEPAGSGISSIWSSIGFDKENSMWVSFPSHGTFGVFTVLKYGQPTYALTGQPVPDITITLASSGNGTDSPRATPDSQFFTFDAAGNMWVSLGNSVAGSNGLFMISKAQLASSNSALTPAVRWTFGINAQGITFDSLGFLWVADYTNNRLTKYDPRNPVSGAGPGALITITSTSLNGPDGIAFDSSGNLWVANDNDNRFLKFAAADLTTSGAKVPIVVNTPPSISFGNQVAFPNNPQRSGLVFSGAPLTP